jgi:hypothetical protein
VAFVQVRVARNVNESNHPSSSRSLFRYLNVRLGREREGKEAKDDPANQPDRDAEEGWSAELESGGLARAISHRTVYSGQFMGT